jgi:hypothetical protein
LQLLPLCVAPHQKILCQYKPFLGPCRRRNWCRHRRRSLHEPLGSSQGEIPSGDYKSYWRSRETNMVFSEGHPTPTGMERLVSRRRTKHRRQRIQLGPIFLVVSLTRPWSFLRLKLRSYNMLKKRATDGDFSTPLSSSAVLLCSAQASSRFTTKAT